MLKKIPILQRMANNIKVLERAAQVQAHHGQRENVNDASREPMSERQFINAFGSKVVFFRLSNRADFVGCIVCGKNTGLMVHRTDKGERRIRFLTVEPCKEQIHGRMTVTTRYLRVRENDSISNMLPALRKYVQ